MRCGYYKILLLILCLLFFYDPALAEEKKIAVIKEIKDSLKTNIIGTSENTPPYVKIIRSKAGLEYLINDFKKIRNYIVFDKVIALERELSKINFNDLMLIAILTQPKIGRAHV